MGSTLIRILCDRFWWWIRFGFTWINHVAPETFARIFYSFDWWTVTLWRHLNETCTWNRNIFFLWKRVFRCMWNDDKDFFLTLFKIWAICSDSLRKEHEKMNAEKNCPIKMFPYHFLVRCINNSAENEFLPIINIYLIIWISPKPKFANWFS